MQYNSNSARESINCVLVWDTRCFKGFRLHLWFASSGTALTRLVRLGRTNLVRLGRTTWSDQAVWGLVRVGRTTLVRPVPNYQNRAYKFELMHFLLVPRIRLLRKVQLTIPKVPTPQLSFVGTRSRFWYNSTPSRVSKPQLSCVGPDPSRLIGDLR